MKCNLIDEVTFSSLITFKAAESVFWLKRVCPGWPNITAGLAHVPAVL